MRVLCGLRRYLMRKINSIPVMDSEVREMITECKKNPKPMGNPSAYENVVEKSDLFPINFPIQSIRCKSLASKYSKDDLRNNITSTYPIMHSKVVELACAFILHKRTYGSSKERELYKDMSLTSFVNRLLQKRSVAFYGAGDKYILHSKEHGYGGWEMVGTDNERSPLHLENCLSYDEMRFSAMLYVSGHTIFINDGSRDNVGKFTTKDVEKNGVIIGLIGTRFEVEGKMEYQDIVIDKSQNTWKNGYGIDQNLCTPDEGYSSKRQEARDLWRKFYNIPSLTYTEAQSIYADLVKNDSGKYLDFNGANFFDNKVYAAHLSIPFDCALVEASSRAMRLGKYAYLHVVGIGLGVWRIFGHQNGLFVETFLKRIEKLCPVLSHLSDVHFAYIRAVPLDVLGSTGKFIECSSHPLGGIRVHLSNREPSSNLRGEHKGKLLVETYAWDGNAQPGNEFWDGSLSGSGDPAAACSSQVAELHNSHINTEYVCGTNLHVVTESGQICHISDFPLP